MFQYKKHRLHVPHSSFQIPDGYYLDPDLCEVTENLLKLWPPAMEFYMEIRLDTDCRGAEMEMYSLLADLSPNVLRSPAAVVVGGLSGFHATYRTRREQYYELWLDLEPGMALCVLVVTKGNIQDVNTEDLLADMDIRCED